MVWRRVGPGRWERVPKQPGARWVKDGFELVRGKLRKKWKPVYEKPAPIDKAALVVAIAALPAELEKKIMDMPVKVRCEQPLCRMVVNPRSTLCKKKRRKGIDGNSGYHFTYPYMAHFKQSTYFSSNGRAQQLEKSNHTPTSYWKDRYLSELFRQWIAKEHGMMKRLRVKMARHTFTGVGTA